ncbi:MAG: carboxypeptidase-like regulatory domain-containing protein [Micromonosporaceae bacterium]
MSVVWLPVAASFALSCRASIPQSSSLAGRILSTVDSIPVREALVIFDDSTHKRYAALTDTTGAFRITSLPPGSYSLTVVRITYPTYHSLLALQWGETRTLTLLLDPHCVFDSVSAIRDISERHPRLVFNGGIAPDAISPTDRAFERQYGIEYVVLGDGEPSAPECLARNNRVVARFLDRQYGPEWRTKVREQ